MYNIQCITNSFCFFSAWLCPKCVVMIISSGVSILRRYVLMNCALFIFIYLCLFYIFMFMYIFMGIYGRNHYWDRCSISHVLFTLLGCGNTIVCLQPPTILFFYFYSQCGTQCNKIGSMRHSFLYYFLWIFRNNGS